MSNNPQYISCIKIGGNPIIPPLITQKIRKECLEYKQKAVEMEKKKERNRLFKKCIDDLEKLKIQTKDLTKLQEQPVHKTLENQLAFTEDLTTKTSSHVPYETYKKLKNLKRETIDVSEYSTEGVKLIGDLTSDTKSNDVNDTPPKLIRSNSYIVDSPSPILLAHLEKEARKCIEVEDSPTDSRSLSPITIIDSEIEPKQVEIVETDILVQQLSVSTQSEPEVLNASDKLMVNRARNILELFEQQQEQLKNKILNEQLRDLVSEESPTSVSYSSSQNISYSILGVPETPAPVITEQNSPEKNENVVHLKNVRNCKSNMDLKKEWAASVIGAAVRGYLVRRLIRTEKVQNLIDTIKDALLCAIQLHSAEVIEEADVELHRRLIQQVSAACYAFHDVFFSLSVKEQMELISLDRQRRLEKAKRPMSARSSQLSTPRRTRRGSAKLVR